MALLIIKQDPEINGTYVLVVPNSKKHTASLDEKVQLVVNENKITYINHGKKQELVYEQGKEELVINNNNYQMNHSSDGEIYLSDDNAGIKYNFVKKGSYWYKSYKKGNVTYYTQN